jgi:hypothetical protein
VPIADRVKRISNAKTTLRSQRTTASQLDGTLSEQAAPKLSRRQPIEISFGALGREVPLVVEDFGASRFRVERWPNAKPASSRLPGELT